MIDLLKSIRWFSQLDNEALQSVQTVIQPMTFEAGELICREGEAGDRMFVIATGDVAVLKNVEDGPAVEVTILHRGDIAGEMGLFGDRSRSATLKARSRCEMLTLVYDDFERLLERESTIARALLAYMSGHLERETSAVAQLRSQDVETGLRVAFFSASPYRNQLYTQLNCHGFAMHFFPVPLSIDTVPLATAFPVVVASANDCFDEAVIEGLHALGVDMIALRCAGYNNVDLTACDRLGMSVARVPAYSPYSVAEHAVALMMALNRRTHRAHIRIRDSNFSLDGLVGFDMHGKTAGVIGTGKIGACTLEILHGFGCRLLAHSRSPKQDLIHRLGVRFVELDELLAESDIISLHAALTPDTYHLVDAQAIDKMKPGVMLVNTARGGLIDTEALLEGLKSGKIGYAGLDVYEEEAKYFYRDFSNSYIDDDTLARLTTFGNVMVTGHQGSLTQDAQSNIVETTLDNIREYELGKRGSELTNAIAPSSHA
jgi:D-lactate dehydrogenase